MLVPQARPVLREQPEQPVQLERRVRQALMVKMELTERVETQFSMAQLIQ